MPELIKVIRKATDPITSTRVSIGGGGVIGYYFVYRGTLDDARKALDVIQEHIKDMEEQPIESE